MCWKLEAVKRTIVSFASSVINGSVRTNLFHSSFSLMFQLLINLTTPSPRKSLATGLVYSGDWRNLIKGFKNENTHGIRLTGVRALSSGRPLRFRPNTSTCDGILRHLGDECVSSEPRCVWVATCQCAVAGTRFFFKRLNFWMLDKCISYFQLVFVFLLDLICSFWFDILDVCPLRWEKHRFY